MMDYGIRVSPVG